MSLVFLFLFLISVFGLVVGLVKPSLVKIKLRKNIAYIFGGGIVVFFFAIGIATPAKPVSTSNNNQSASAPTAQTSSSAPVQTTTVATPPALETDSQKLIDTAQQASQSATIVATSVVSITPTSFPSQTSTVGVAESLQANDELYLNPISYGSVKAGFGIAGQDLAKVGQDLQERDYSAAIRDMQSVQSDLQDCQSDIQYSDTFAPFTPDITRIDTLINDAVSEGLKGTDIGITDMENGNYDGVNDVAMPDFIQMNVDLNKAQELIAGWEAKNE